MKTCVLFMAFYCFVMNPSSAKIKNGYTNDIHSAYFSLRSLNTLLPDNNTVTYVQRRTIRNCIKVHVEFITYKEFTDKMLLRFKAISPELYHQIDTLKDRHGRPIDVYVKFLEDTDLPPGIAGITNLNQDENDPDAYFSEYGIHTVSVRIAAGTKCLTFLAHEFGHVRYQVPNLRDYFQFYKNLYISKKDQTKALGHSSNDPSGKSAFKCSKEFNKKCAEFLKLKRNKIESYVVLLQEIRNRIEESQSEPQQSAGF